MAPASTSFFDTLATEHIRSLTPYQPGKPVEDLERELGVRDAIKLASNENPLGPSPRAVEAAIRAAAEVHRYPDPGAHVLRHTLAERLGISSDEIILGSGSNELIYLVIQALCRPGHDEVLSHRHAFVSYRLAAQSFGVRFVESEVSSDLRCDVDALIGAITARTKVVFLANPNNPTGSYVSKADFERILAALPERALLVVDEAYYEYGVAANLAGEADYPQSQRYRTPDMPRIFTMRTFSKIHGLAGLRVGYGIGDARVVEVINRVRQVFNVSLVAQAAARAALDDEEHVERSVEAARAGLATIAEGIGKLGLKVYPSLGNFLLVGAGDDAEPLYQALLRKGVIVRPLKGWGLPRHLRITTGTAAENQRLLAALAEVMVETRAAVAAAGAR